GMTPTGDSSLSASDAFAPSGFFAWSLAHAATASAARVIRNRFIKTSNCQSYVVRRNMQTMGNCYSWSPRMPEKVRRYVLKQPVKPAKVYRVKYEDELNAEQLEVVMAGDGPLLVIAG